MAKRPIEISLKGDVYEYVVLQTIDNLSQSFAVSPLEDLGSVIERSCNATNFSFNNTLEPSSKKRIYRFMDATVTQRYRSMGIYYRFHEWQI